MNQRNGGGNRIKKPPVDPDDIKEKIKKHFEHVEGEGWENIWKIIEVSGYSANQEFIKNNPEAITTIKQVLKKLEEEKFLKVWTPSKMSLETDENGLLDSNILYGRRKTEN